ncbi:Mediator of RNA polymerase II transcription subunit 27 [Ananas comosus]|uniref:Mediator of RNA polymerase II transcription subunit 27 n=1 Tax=Ananas comosus TaxID=4615 RepID=A0A199VGH5_ANACO|nr:Mediator of RNA polymerase II transcription subunit 27 [Ananas comosus]
MMQHQGHTAISVAPAPAPEPAKETAESGGGEGEGEAPPKQVAQAMERLGRAGRLIADIRIGADRLLEALFVAASDQPRHSARTARLITDEEASMRRHFQDLRALGRQLEDSGVLNPSLKSRGNSWGLHMPLVCPDGAVVAYAWKRQLAGQAGASAVDRTRLALKAFTDQKRRFFPHLEDDLLNHHGESGVAKRLCSSQVLPMSKELVEGKTLADILKNLEHEVPNIRILTYQRRDWSKRASLLSSSVDENHVDPSKEQNLHNWKKLRSASVDQIAVIELLMPSIFRAVVSLHPAGSVNPDAVAFFSPNEESFAREVITFIQEAYRCIMYLGLSRKDSLSYRFDLVYVHLIFILQEHADKALQYYLSVDPNNSLPLLLCWICSYQTLFAKVCSKCGRLLMMDKTLALLLPPVHRPYFLTSSVKGQSSDLTKAYHIGCSSEEI